MEKEKKKRFECYVNYEELQAFYRAQGEISLIFHVSRAVFPSSLLYRDRKIILRSEFQLFEFSFSKGEGGGGESEGPANACPSIKKSIKHHFLSSAVFKNILPICEDSGRWNQAKCKIPPNFYRFFFSKRYLRSRKKVECWTMA